MQELISIIVPVYNVASLLPQCLESVCAQTYRRLEIILVDDGSTDGSGQLCDEWAKRDDRVRVIHKRNGGVSSARNAGMAEATGQLIGFVDSDDWIEMTMYEKLIQGIGDADLVACGYMDYPMGTMEPAVPRGLMRVEPCDIKTALQYIYAKEGYFTAIWNKLFRREVVERGGRPIQMDTSLSWGEDELWLAEVLSGCKRMAFVPEILYYWRPREGSATRNNVVKERHLSVLKSKKRAMALLPQDVATQRLIKARMFNDCYSLKVMTYCAKDWEKYRIVSQELREIRDEWMKSGDPSLMRKVKVALMECEMKLRLPGRLVQSTDSVRRYGIKNS